MQILLTIPDDYQPENSDIPEENNPFSRVQAALEHFEIPSWMFLVSESAEISAQLAKESTRMLNLLRRQHKADATLYALLAPECYDKTTYEAALDEHDKVHIEIGELLKEIDND
jgi:hypothetical protein